MFFSTAFFMEKGKWSPSMTNKQTERDFCLWFSLTFDDIHFTEPQCKSIVFWCIEGVLVSKLCSGDCHNSCHRGCSGIRALPRCP